jgi:geranylgeranylglycerol-phosphate geranylgeranyltransferase
MSPWSRLGALATLCRPLNCAIAAASAAVGALTAGVRPLPAAAAASAAVATALVAGAGNAFNDWVDLDIDRVNRPSRPLPAGRVPRWVALPLAGLLAGAGIATAARVGPGHGLVALTVVGLLALYSLALKGTVLWGNLLVAGLAAAVFPFGATAAGAWGRSWVPAGFALLFHLGREIVKDMEDVTGDRAGRAGTVAVRWGQARARAVATAVLLVLVVFTLLPALAGLYGPIYLVSVALLAALVLQVVVEMHRRPQLLASGRLGRRLKAGMLVGLGAVALAEIAG